MAIVYAYVGSYSVAKKEIFNVMSSIRSMALKAKFLLKNTTTNFLSCVSGRLLLVSVNGKGQN